MAKTLDCAPMRQCNEYVQFSVDVQELAVHCVQLRCLWFVFELNS